MPRLHIWRAFACCKQGKYRDALKDANQAIALTRNNENCQCHYAEALEVKGESLFFLGHPEEAIEHIKLALAIFSDLNDHEYIAYSHMVLGYVKMNSGRYDIANKHFLTALDIYLMTNNALRQSNLYLNLGASNIYLGDLSNAQTYLNKAFQIAKRLGYLPGKGQALIHLGAVYAELSFFDLAKELFNQAKIIAQQTEKRNLFLFLELQESKIARVHQQIDRAHRALQSAEAIVMQIEARDDLGLWALEKGCLSLFSRDYLGAINSFQKACSELQTVGFHPEATQAHLYLACAYHASGDETKTAHHLNEASKYAAKLDSLHPLITAGRDAKDILVAAKKSPEFGDFATRLIETVEQFDKDLPRLRRLIRQQCEQVDMSKPELTILTLGNARVRTYSEEVTKTEWTNQKAVRELFFLLLAYPDGLKKEEIGDALWPNSTPHQQYKQLNNTIYRLRRALGKNVVVFDTQSSCYHFNWAMDYHYDVEAFQDLVKQAQREKNSSQEIALYKQVINLYRGTYLPDVDGIWTVPLREFLRRTYTNAVLRVAELHFKDGKYEKVLGYCQQILNDDLCQEAAHRLAMRAYAARGNRVEIARQFEICRQSLQQLDTEPSAKTQRLFEQLMR